MNEKRLAEIRSWINDGCRGMVLTERYTRMIDEVVRSIYYEDDPGAGLVLMATGGYGRGEMAPYSDVDVMLYASGRQNTEKAEMVLYRLWDSGLDISHSFRTAAECIEESRRDIKTRTSLLELRYVAGERDLYDAFRSQVYPEIAYKRQREFVREKLKEMEKRHLNTGNSVFLLEPQIKEGEGGLRDIHTACWLSRVALKWNCLEDILRILSPYEYKRLLAAYDFMLRTRFILHLESGRKNDILSFEYQKNTASLLGFRDSSKFSASERMLRYYYLKSNTIKYLSRKITVACSRHYVSVPKDMNIKRISGDFSLSGGSLIATRKNLFSRNPEKIIEAFTTFSRSGKCFSDTMQEMIRTNLVRIGRKTRNSPAAVGNFIEIFRGGRVYETLRAMHESGVLGRFVPEFGALLLLVVHEPYHMYTVDEHTLLAIRNLEALRTSCYKSLEDLHDIMNGMRHFETLYMALLFHDIGKAAGRRHEEEGYKRLKNIMERFNLDTRRRARIEFLVRNHVLMSRIALRRETTDIDIVSGFAEAVGDLENLQAIYLITYADMSAVNPGFWTSWKAFLLRELYEHTRDYLAGITRDRQEYLRSIQSLAKGGEMPGLVDFIEEMPERYTLGTPRRKVIEDFSLVQKAKDIGFALRIDAGTDGLVELSICAEDSPGLFSRIVGFLSSKGLNIVSGRIFTGKKGIVIDKITLSNWKEVWWDGLSGDIAAGLEDIIVHRKPVAVISRSGVASSHFDGFIELDNETSEEFSIIEIFSPDRQGLLFDIAAVMHSMDIDIVSARIHTETGLAQDIFYILEKKAKINHMKIEALLSSLWSILKK